MTLEKTIQATFKGVPFLVNTETQEGGRKVAIHDYPGSDSRFVEDLGKIPGAFTIRGFVSSDKSVDNWLQNDRRLTTALEDSSEGILEMSVFGIRKVKALNYSKTIRQTAVGRVDYVLSFMVTKATPSPAVAASSTETVAQRAKSALSITDTIFAEDFKVPVIARTTQVSTYDGEILVKTIGDSIASLAQDLGQVTSKVNVIRDNINDLVRDPITYAQELFGGEGLFGTIFDGVSATRDALNALSDLCRAGYNLSTDFKSIEDFTLSNAEQSFDIPVFADNAAYRITNNDSRLFIVNSMRSSLFVNYLQIAASSDYDTDSEINITISDINDVYENVVLLNDVDPLLALALDKCRIECLNVLETKIQVTPKVIDFNLRVPTEDIELTYRLYAEEFESSDDLVSKAEVLTKLNGILPMNFSGDVLVLKV